MAYVDGYVVPVPVARISEYLDLARLGAKLWMEHGALSVTEAQADDAPVGTLTSFPRSVQMTDAETVFFSWITYRDRAHRDAVNALVMADPRLNMDMAAMPFDGKRMIWGGFDIKVTG